MLTLQLKKASDEVQEAVAALELLFVWRSDEPPLDTWVLRKGSEAPVFISMPVRDNWLCYTEAGDACPMTWYTHRDKWCPIWRPEEE